MAQAHQDRFRCGAARHHPAGCALNAFGGAGGSILSGGDALGMTTVLNAPILGLPVGLRHGSGRGRAGRQASLDLPLDEGLDELFTVGRRLAQACLAELRAQGLDPDAAEVQVSAHIR